MDLNLPDGPISNPHPWCIKFVGNGGFCLPQAIVQQDKKSRRSSSCVSVVPLGTFQCQRSATLRSSFGDLTPFFFFGESISSANSIELDVLTGSIGARCFRPQLRDDFVRGNRRRTFLGIIGCLQKPERVVPRNSIGSGIPKGKGMPMRQSKTR